MVTIGDVDSEASAEFSLNDATGENWVWFDWIENDERWYTKSALFGLESDRHDEYFAIRFVPGEPIQQ